MAASFFIGCILVNGCCRQQHREAWIENR